MGANIKLLKLIFIRRMYIFKKIENIFDSVLRRFRNGDTVPSDIKKVFSSRQEEINNLM